MTRMAFILGGSGQIGRAISQSLLNAGWSVTVAHRGRRAVPIGLVGQGATVLALDRDMPGDLARALGSGADALIDVTAYGPDHARQVLEVQHSIGSMVVISSSSVYRDDAGRTLDEATQNGFPHLPEPIPETQSTVDPGPATYSTRKVALERMLLDEATTPVTVLRPAAIHGLGSIHPREWWFVKRIMDGREAIPIAYKGASRFHTSACANIAELVRIVLEAPGSRVLNIADPSAPSVADIAALIAQHMGYTGRIVPMEGDAFPSEVGRNPWAVPRPFVLDTAAAVALGYAPMTTYAESVGPICDELVETAGSAQDWRTLFPILASYPYDQFDYPSEDEYFAER